MTQTNLKEHGVSPLDNDIEHTIPLDTAY